MGAVRYYIYGDYYVEQGSGITIQETQGITRVVRTRITNLALGRPLESTDHYHRKLLIRSFSSERVYGNIVVELWIGTSCY